MKESEKRITSFKESPELWFKHYFPNGFKSIKIHLDWGRKIEGTITQ